jgi:hypothetical protein
MADAIKSGLIGGLSVLLAAILNYLLPRYDALTTTPFVLSILAEISIIILWPNRTENELFFTRKRMALTTLIVIFIITFAISAIYLPPYNSCPEYKPCSSCPNNSPTITEIEWTALSNPFPNDTIVFNAKATDPEGDPIGYMYSIKKAYPSDDSYDKNKNTDWTNLTNWSSENLCFWKVPLGVYEDSGPYLIEVCVRDGKHSIQNNENISCKVGVLNIPIRQLHWSKGGGSKG